MTRPLNPNGEIHRQANGAWELRCPACGHWGDIDDDQLHGRVSVDHTHTDYSGRHILCTFHETRDWSVTADLIEVKV